MARAIWSGAVTFGLVSVPVKLVSAVQPKEVRFHLLHDKDGARIREKRVCAAEDEEVPYEHVVKGYEVGRGEYVTLTREELGALAPRATRTIDIEDFVGLDEIEPIYYDRTYLLVPDRGGEKPYALLVATMEKTRKVAIARFVLRTRQYLCAVRPHDGALALSTMLWADEVVAVDQVEGLPRERKPNARELAMAEQLVASLTTEFRAQKYQDDYRDRLLALIEQKREGQVVVAPEEPARPAKIIDLMDALRASLDAKKATTKKAPRQPARAARPHRHRRREAKRSA